MFKIIETVYNDSNTDSASVKFNLLKGWLDILLTKTTPKPEDFHTKPFEKAFCKLNADGAFNLL